LEEYNYLLNNEEFAFEHIGKLQYNIESEDMGDVEYEIFGDISFDVKNQLYCDMIDAEPEELGWEHDKTDSNELKLIDGGFVFTEI